MFGIEGFAQGMAAHLEAQQNAWAAEDAALAKLTPYEREHLHQVRDHARQYQAMNAPRVTYHSSGGSAPSYSAGDGGAMAFAGGLLIGSMID